MGVRELFIVTLGDSPQARAAAYAKWLEASLFDNEWDRIRNATQQGRVAGSGASSLWRHLAVGG